MANGEPRIGLEQLGRLSDHELAPLDAAELSSKVNADPDLNRQFKEIARLKERLSEVFGYFAPLERVQDDILNGLPDPKRLLDIPRFGELVIALGLADLATVNKALEQQAELLKKGTSEKIGSVLVRNGSLKPDDIDRILKTQGEQGSLQALGGFEILEQVGRGGMGVVYKAHQLSMGRDVAIKVLYPRLATDRKFVESFISEAHSVAQLSHPSIISGIDAGEQDG